jgi:hypothetical protein
MCLSSLHIRGRCPPCWHLLQGQLPLLLVLACDAQKQVPAHQITHDVPELNDNVSMDTKMSCN